MNEDENDLSPDGEQDYTGDDDGGNGNYDTYDDGQEGQEEGDDVQGEGRQTSAGFSEGEKGQRGSQVERGRVQEEETQANGVIASLGPVATAEEINDLAAELGFTPTQFAKAANFFGKIAAHQSAAQGISNAHLQEEVMNSPGLRGRVALIQRELAGVPAERQTDKRTVQWAIATSFIVEAKPSDTWQDIAKRIAKSAGLTVGGSTSQSRQDDRTPPRAPVAQSPTGSAGTGARNGNPPEVRKRTPSGAAAFLASRYTGMSANDMDVMKEEIAGRRRAF